MFFNILEILSNFPPYLLNMTAKIRNKDIGLALSRLESWVLSSIELLRKLGGKSGFWSIFSGFTLTVRVITLKIFTNKLIWFTTNIRVSSIRFRQYTLMVRCFQNKYLPLILGSFPYILSHYPDISEEDNSEEDISEEDISEEDISEEDNSGIQLF